MSAEMIAHYGEKNRQEFIAKTLKKKFYRDFSETDLGIIADLQDYMKDCYIQFPPFVLKKMIDREILPNSIKLFDADDRIVKENLIHLNRIPEYNFIKNLVQIATPFEFSNEGIMNPYSPYRIVWVATTAEYTYFVKTALPPHDNIVRVIDVWRKQGGVPIHPLASQKDAFSRGEEWSIYDIIETMVIELENNDDDSGEFEGKLVRVSD